MLGPIKLRRLDQPIAVSLKGLVPANNVYRFAQLGPYVQRPRDRGAVAGRPGKSIRAATGSMLY
jgi:hypothetical protein